MKHDGQWYWDISWVFPCFSWLNKCHLSWWVVPHPSTISQRNGETARLQEPLLHDREGGIRQLEAIQEQILYNFGEAGSEEKNEAFLEVEWPKFQDNKNRIGKWWKNDQRPKIPSPRITKEFPHFGPSVYRWNLLGGPQCHSGISRWNGAFLRFQLWRLHRLPQLGWKLWSDPKVET